MASWKLAPQEASLRERLVQLRHRRLAVVARADDHERLIAVLARLDGALVALAEDAVPLDDLLRLEAPAAVAGLFVALRRLVGRIDTQCVFAVLRREHDRVRLL